MANKAHTPTATKRTSVAAKQPRARRLSRLALGLMVTLSTIAFSPQLADISNTVRFSLLAAGLLLGTLALGKSLQSRHPSISLRTALPLVSLILFLLLQAASILWAANRAETLFEVGKWILVLASIVVARPLLQRHPLHFVVTLSRVSLVVFVVSLSVAAWQMTQIGDFSWSNRYAITSLFSHKGTYSMMIVLAMAFPLIRLRLLRDRRTRLYWTLIVAELALLIFLQARAAWVALAATGCALALSSVISRWQRRSTAFRYSTIPHIAATLLLATAIGVGAVGGCHWFCGQTLPDPSPEGGLRANATIHERQALWRMTYRLVDTHPMLGCGAGNWKVCYPSVGVGDVFSIDLLDFNFIRPHNDYLRVLSETGYLGIALLLLALSGLIIGAVTVPHRMGCICRMAVAFVVGIMAFALFDFPIDRIELLLWTAMLAATAQCGQNSLSLRIPTEKRAHTRPHPMSRIPQVLLCAALLATLLLGIARWRSEAHYGPIVAGIHHRQWQRVEFHCREARTPWNNLTALGMPLAYYEAMAREQQGKPVLATFEEALRATPWCKQALCDLGRLQYTQQHNADSAILLLREAIRISPSYTYAYLNLAQVYLLEHRPDEAYAVLDSLDLDRKEADLQRMVWHYHQGRTAYYYTDELVAAERKAVQRIRRTLETAQPTAH